MKRSIGRVLVGTTFTPAGGSFSTMRRRALLATGAAASTASLAGCPMPPWAERPERIDGAEVTFRREHTDEFDPSDSDTLDAVELYRDLDLDPPRLLIRGRSMGGDRDC